VLKAHSILLLQYEIVISLSIRPCSFGA